MYSSMVVVRGNPGKKILENEYTDVGELAGMQFIKLRHNRGFGMPGSDGDGVHGFQAVQVFIRGDRNRITYDWKPDQDENGKPIVGHRQLVFRAHEKTGEYHAMLPDTSENRRVLACCYNHNAQWSICDKNIDSEVRAIADDLDSKLPKVKSKEEVIREQAELLKKYQEKEELEKRDRERLNKVGEDATAVLTDAEEPDVETPAVEAEASDAIPDDGASETRWPSGRVRLADTGLLEKAKEIVENKTHKDLCDDLKKQYGPDKWKKSYAYQTKVTKAIKATFNKLRTQNVNHPANSDNDQGGVSS